ncbi:unnamed protein product, partial [Hydatigera taeniaeformis]|uniref:Uncharacterized protein n=1 Tax=Hydatigena taeniaeformis TaxID=6205 RepID=A0A0R3WYT7_HYDTA
MVQRYCPMLPSQASLSGGEKADGSSDGQALTRRTSKLDARSAISRMVVVSSDGASSSSTPIVGAPSPPLQPVCARADSQMEWCGIVTHPLVEAMIQVIKCSIVPPAPLHDPSAPCQVLTLVRPCVVDNLLTLQSLDAVVLTFETVQHGAQQAVRMLSWKHV